MNLKKSALGILVLIISLFWATNPSEAQSTTCTVDIISTSVSGNLVVGSPVTFKVNATSNCVGSIYYKFFYRANYGTANYETSPWVSMTTADYVTDNELTYSFPSAGKYIVIAWAFADPATLDANTVSLIGFSVDITQAEGSTCPVDITGMSVTGVMAPGLPVTIKVTAAKRCTGPVYYKYFYRAKYATSDYNTSPWVSMTTADYVTTNQIEYRFPEAGNHIVVVWVFTDPNNLDSTSVPIIGGNVAIGDASEMKVLMELGDYTVTLPTTGNILLQIDEENTIGSAVHYGTATAGGPGLPITKITAQTIVGQFETLFDSRGRPTAITEGTMRIVITYNADGSFNYEAQENGTVIYSGSNRDLLSEPARRASGGCSDDTYVPTKKAALPARSRAAESEDDPALERELYRRYVVLLLAEKVTKFQFTKEENLEFAERVPFVRAMFENAALKKVTDQILVIALHQIGTRNPKEVCRNATSPADCERKVRAGYEALNQVQQFLESTAEGIVAEEWDTTYKNLPFLYPATYTGRAAITATGCGSCSGEDTVKIELKDDGSLTARWNFNIETTGSSCSFAYPGGRIKTGTHDFRGHFMIPDHGIAGTYTKTALSGFGTKYGLCTVYMSLALTR